jgi:hypothetical protein
MFATSKKLNLILKHSHGTLATCEEHGCDMCTTICNINEKRLHHEKRRLQHVKNLLQYRYITSGTFENNIRNIEIYFSNITTPRPTTLTPLSIACCNIQKFSLQHREVTNTTSRGPSPHVHQRSRDDLSRPDTRGGARRPAPRHHLLSVHERGHNDLPLGQMLAVELGGLRPDARSEGHLAACSQALIGVAHSIHGRRARIPTSWEG